MGNKFKVTLVWSVQCADSEWKAVDHVHTCLRGVTSNFEILKVEKEA